MKFTLRLEIGGVCGFLAGKCPQMNLYSRLESTSIPADAHQADAVVFPGTISVLLIGCIGSLAEVLPSVVVANMIFMVNLILRPFSGNVQPRKPMRFVGVFVDFDYHIALFAFVSRDFSKFGLASGS